MPREIITGKPGDVWTNTGPKIKYQAICKFHNSCGVCIQWAYQIGAAWPFPYHRGCRCQNRPIFPGQSSLPFLDFREEIDKLDPHQQAVVVGRSNLILINKGIVDWSDVVTKTRVRDLREVVSLKKLRVDEMVKAGLTPAFAERAYATVHTPAHELADAQRKRLIADLEAGGLSRQLIKEGFGEGIAARVKVKPIVVKPVPEPPPVHLAPPPAEIHPVVAEKLGVKPASTARPALARALDVAKTHGVDVEPNGHGTIVAQYGEEHARDIHAAYDSRTKKVYINERSSYWDDPKATMAKSDRRKWFSSSAEDHVIHHEIGHALHDRSDPELYRSMRGRRFSAGRIESVKASVSRYAAKSQREFVAEVYSGLVSGRQFDESTLKLYGRLGGPIPGKAHPGPKISDQGGDEGSFDAARTLSGRKLPKPSDVKVRAAADKIEMSIARAIGGKRLRGYEEADVVVPVAGHKGPLAKENAILPGVARHAIEVKSLSFGEGDDLSVHANALVRKVDFDAANPQAVFHTVAVDIRGSKGFAKYGERYSGHTLYYKRTSGPFFLSKMYKVKDEEELKSLIGMSDDELPEAARGVFPSGDELERLRETARAEKEYNDRRSRGRKQAIREAKMAAGSGG